MSVRSQVGQSVAILLRMVLDPLNALETSCILLKDKISPDEMLPELSDSIQAIGRATKKLKDEVQYLRSVHTQEFDVSSPVKTASQIRQKVSQWEEYERVLVNAVERIRGLRERGLILKDHLLDAILGEVILDALCRLLRYIDYMSTIEGKDLIYGSNKRTARLEYLLPRSLMKESEAGYPTTSTARTFVYGLTWILDGLMFGNTVLKKKAPQEILAPINIIGKCSKKFQDEVKNFGDAFLKETDLTPNKAVEQIHQQVKAWKTYETELSNAIQQIRQALASGLKVDADTEAIIAGAFFDAFEHLERELRRLETIQAEDF